MDQMNPINNTPFQRVLCLSSFLMALFLLGELGALVEVHCHKMWLTACEAWRRWESMVVLLGVPVLAIMRGVKSLPF